MDTITHEHELDLASDEGFRGVWESYEPELRRFAMRLLSDSSSAEDAVQDAFLRAWQRADSYDAAKGTPRAWLFAVLRNVIIDRARMLARRPRTVGASLDVAAPDDDERQMTALVVAEALERLSDDHRHAIVERYYRGRSGAEVARRAGLPIGTVRSRLFYALKALGVALNELGFER